MEYQHMITSSVGIELHVTHAAAGLLCAAALSNKLSTARHNKVGLNIKPRSFKPSLLHTPHPAATVTHAADSSQCVAHQLTHKPLETGGSRRQTCMPAQPLLLLGLGKPFQHIPLATVPLQHYIEYCMEGSLTGTWGQH
jgi:hypothetical protein